MYGFVNFLSSLLLFSSVQYDILAIYSVLLTSVISVPYILSFLMVRKLNSKILSAISKKEAVLIGILTGQLIILIPSIPVTIFHPFNVNYLYVAILFISLALPISILFIYNKKFQINYTLVVELIIAQLKNPLYDIILVILIFYAYLIFIIPVDLSFDAVNYYLPYSQGLLKKGFAPSNPFFAYKVLGATPNQPQGLPVMYSYALNFIPHTDSFKLFPSLFLIQLVLSGSLLAKEIYSKIPSTWVALIIIVMPPTFVYLTTTPYNADLLFYSFFISALFFVIKARKQSNILWSFFAGGSITGMILTRDFGIFFIIPILSVILLGSKRTGKFWVVPLCLQLLIPVLLFTNAQLSQVYSQHSIALIILQTAILIVSYLLSRNISFPYSIRWTYFVLGIIPAIVFSIWIVHIWGSPISRTQATFFLGSSLVDYRWASDIALKELKDFAFAIAPRTGPDMFLNIGYLFIAPAIGGLFFVPKLVGIVQSTRLKNIPRTPTVMFLIIVMNWLTIVGGFAYDDISTFRHLFDVLVMLSILSALGIMVLLQDRYPPTHLNLIFLVSISLIFAIETLSYFDYVGSAFTLNSRTIISEPIFRLTISSIAIFSILYYIPELVKRNLSKILRPYIYLILTGTIIASATIPIIGETLSVIAANGSSYDRTYETILLNIPSYQKHVQVQQYFNSKIVDGNILAYAVDSLAYRAPRWNVSEMRVIIDLALLKPILTGNTTSEIIHNLKDNNIRYIVVPLYGDSAVRFTKLYKYTGLLDILKPPYTIPLRKYGNIGILELTYK